MDPEGLRYALNDLYRTYQKPLFIVENGLGAYDTIEAGANVHDAYRIAYLRAHIEQMEKRLLRMRFPLWDICPGDALTAFLLEPARWKSGMDSCMSTGIIWETARWNGLKRFFLLVSKPDQEQGGSAVSILAIDVGGTNIKYALVDREDRFSLEGSSLRQYAPWMTSAPRLCAYTSP